MLLALSMLLMLFVKLAMQTSTSGPNPVTSLQGVSVPQETQNQLGSRSNITCIANLKDNRIRIESTRKELSFRFIEDDLNKEYIRNYNYGDLNNLTIFLGENHTLGILKELRCKALTHLTVVCDEKPKPNSRSQNDEVLDLCLPFEIQDLTVRSVITIPGIDSLIKKIKHSLTVNIEYYPLMDKMALIRSKINILKITDASPEKIIRMHELEKPIETVRNEHIKQICVRMRKGIVIPINNAGYLVNTVFAWAINMYPRITFLDVEDKDYSESVIKVLFSQHFRLNAKARNLKILFVNNIFIFVENIKNRLRITPPLYAYAEFKNESLYDSINLGKNKDYPCKRAMTHKEYIRSRFVSRAMNTSYIEEYRYIKKDFMELFF